MTTTTSATAQLELGDVLSTTTRTLTSQALPIALACALAILPFTMLDLLFASDGAVSPTILNLVSGVATCWLYAVIAHLTLAAHEGRTLTFGDAASRAMPAIGTVFALTLLQGIVMLFGVVALVAPAVLFWVWTYVALPAAVFERLTGIAALRRSAELTEGHRGPIFALGVVTLIALVAGLVIVFSPLLVAILDPDAGALDRALASEAVGYGLIVGTSLLQALWSTVTTVAMTVVYARLRDLRVGVDGEALARVFA